MRIGFRSKHGAILMCASSDGPTPEAMSQQILSVAPIVRGQTSQTHPGNRPHQPHAQPAAASGDLIDFGDSTNPTPNSTSTQQQRQSSQAQTPLLDLQDPLEPGHPVKRVDTFTSDLDEFVDANP